MLSSTFGGSCPRCKHNLKDHRCDYTQWEKVADVQVSVHQDLKEKWEVAKNAKQKREVFTAAYRKALNDLDQVVNRATDDLRQLVERHEFLALGSFAGQASSAFELLKLRYEALQEKKDVSRDQLEKEQTSLDRMERRLGVLETAMKGTQKATVRIGSQVL